MRSTGSGGPSWTVTRRDRVAVAEAWLPSIDRAARYVRPDELHQAFNFDFLGTAWSAPDYRQVIDASLAVMDEVGAPTTWVMSNHDVVRHASRLAAGVGGVAGGAGAAGGHAADGRPRRRPAPGPGGGPADAGPARLGLPVPGRGARAARGVRPARRCPPGPGLRPFGRGRTRPRRLPGAAAVVRDRTRRTASDPTGRCPGCRSLQCGPTCRCGPSTTTRALPCRSTGGPCGCAGSGSPRPGSSGAARRPTSTLPSSGRLATVGRACSVW